MIDKRPIEDFNFTQEEYDRYQAGEEVWRDVVGWEGVYQASTNGQIRSLDRIVKKAGRENGNYLHGKIMKLTTNQFGYKLIRLQHNKKSLATVSHRITAITFLKNPENKAEVNHIKTFKANNFLWNLEWNTRSENIRNSFTEGSRIPTCQNKFGKDHLRSKPLYQIDKYTNEIIQEYEGLMDACRITGFQFKNMSACALGKRASCMGYKWVYVEDFVPLQNIKKDTA